MDHLFIEPSGKLRDRWLKAFPSATVVTEPGRIDTHDRREAIAWLPVSGGNGADSGTVRAAVSSGLPVVVMSATPGEAEAFRLLNAGAVGYCHIEAAAEQLREIALVIGHGGLWMPPELMQRFLALSVRRAPGAAEREQQLNALTARELLVAEQVSRGASNREIALVLAISERTVKAHLSAIFKKLDVRDRVQLALAMNNLPVHTTIN
jgi:DNA-binding NarL/FixJ family response regulator